MARPLSAWETAIVTVLASVQARGDEAVREAIPRLVVISEADGDDRSFELRDGRRLDAPASDARPFSRADTPDGMFSYRLLVDAHGCPLEVRETRAPGAPRAAPDPEELIVEPDALPTRWRWAAVAAVVAVAGVVLGWSLYNGYGPDTTGKQTCSVQASIVESDEDRQEWFADRCVDAVPTEGR
ncbi:MAG TPA: hypothetical protein VFU93_02630 [Acidimicrobiales bacterium]|nr:hypothetical protein [Acidimicrobiales bacterium]